MKHIFALALFISINLKIMAQYTNPPICEKRPKELIMHGDARIDNYYWLNEYWLKGPDSAKVLDYLSKENSYFEEGTRNTKELQDILYNEMLSKIKQTDETLPYFYNGYWYITRTQEGKEYPIYVRKKISMDEADETLANVNEMAKGFAYYGFSGLMISPDNKIAAYGVDIVSRRNYTVYFKNLENGQLLKDNIPNTNGSVIWANDNKTVFYSVRNEKTLRSEKIMKHVLGTDAKKDVVVYFEKDETYNVDVSKSKSEKYIYIKSGSTLQSEIRIIDADNINTSVKLFQARETNLLYDVEHAEDIFYVSTNWNAKNFKLMKTSLKKTEKSNWEEVVPHREEVLLSDVQVFKNFIVLSERSKGLTQIRIIEPKTKGDFYIPFQEDAYLAYPAFNPDFNTVSLRYGYQSMTTPPSTYELSMDNKSQKLLKEQAVLGGFDKNNYITERQYAISEDGNSIPISIVYKKGFKKDGNMPLLLYAYGSYGISMEPSFSSQRLSLLDRGFAYAIAHIRGGQEMGRNWYEDGKMFKKINTFKDFISCGKWLVQNKYTSVEHLYANGGSAGGLLMGAIVNMEPRLWHGVVAAVPFVDVVTTMLDESIPLTTGEFDEWGNPKNKDSYFYMKSYSPYDNVEKKAYPNMLVTTGLHDSQVQYFEPAKWVAKLRDMKTDKNKLYLYTNMSTGHGGSSGRFQRLKEVARDYAFFLELEGIKK
jgi:oligopeptidase B